MQELRVDQIKSVSGGYHEEPQDGFSAFGYDFSSDDKKVNNAIYGAFAGAFAGLSISASFFKGQNLLMSCLIGAGAGAIVFYNAQKSREEETV